MPMMLLYNIEKFNNTVTIQCSVSMYTEELKQYLSFRITKGATRPLSPDLGHTLSDPFHIRQRAHTLSSHGEHHGLSARVHFCS